MKNRAIPRDSTHSTPASPIDWAEYRRRLAALGWRLIDTNTRESRVVQIESPPPRVGGGE